MVKTTRGTMAGSSWLVRIISCLFASSVYFSELLFDLYYLVFSLFPLLVEVFPFSYYFTPGHGFFGYHRDCGAIGLFVFVFLMTVD